ncbi:hypothetical protein MJO29_003679 [Puccinia striiformis f. sp. tritici]|uniref:Antiviral helicase n=1 Tax=Puccinia striiformis f. sp. tritici PST-78 TaxID=1165861 RepID=A0A0L0V8H1_9BASI|nr:hypothetical protein Pst134EB_007943 [Puccinia striiformis f. sp. tritici]KAI7963252.1 hypothetical protein MJO29_003679 [Puccinia striiformis f. sp. tritici]KNE95294.1 hypothetical protein PSTG_11378 [Puccinia striiformis f. sp. tritici PST-78]
MAESSEPVEKTDHSKEAANEERLSPAELKAFLSERYLTPYHQLPPPWLSTQITHWDENPLLDLARQESINEFLHTQPSPMTTHLEFVFAGLEGDVVDCVVSERPPGSCLTSKTSSSVIRQPANYTSDFIRGRSGNLPFQPGGLVSSGLAEPVSDPTVNATDELEKDLESTRGGIRTIPPGFTRGLDFGAQDGNEAAEDGLQSTFPAANLTPVQLDPVYVSSSNNDWRRKNKGGNTNASQGDTARIDTEVDVLLADTQYALTSAMPVIKPRRQPVVSKRDWAHVVDVNQELANFRELVPNLAREYPFELDTFQKEAIYHLEMGDSVFVAAHTSAGKTVVAEYAVALARRHMTRCIYTSPIKALSNQKFRDFRQTFDAETVGILTGDVQVNPEASCLILTTEILRSMLYKGADLIRDVEFVVFDEVHYINDSERGVVWEEVIIMLPAHVTIILLSATVPNTKEFADWVGRTKQKDIYVISTPKRPVPLEHFLYANKEIHKIVDAKGEFLSQGWKDAIESMKRSQVKEREASGQAPLTRLGHNAAKQVAQRGQQRGRGDKRGGGRGSQSSSHLASAMGRGGGGGPNSGRGHQEDQNRWVHLVGMLKKKELLPVVAFTFSKKRCEENATSMPNTDLCSAREKSEIHVVIERSLTRLNGTDKILPQIIRMRDLLARGIGVHHGGLLPIVKEVVEILFSRGLVKILFATETFAMGVNMPARCVVFSGIQKHDGRSYRELLSGEYTQMSGRAGRRGLDSTGVVIIICGNEVPDTVGLHKMILGPATKLQSQFRLTYNMVLNLLRVEALRVEEMIKSSFSENAQQRLLPEQQKKILEVERELQALPIQDDTDIIQDTRRYHEVSTRLVELNSQLVKFVVKHPSGSRALCSGRLVILNDNHFRHSLAAILKPAQSLRANPGGRLDHTPSYFVLAFVPPDIRAGTNDIAADEVPPAWPPLIQPTTSDLTYELAVVPITSISMLTKHTLSLNVNEIADQHRKSHMVEALNQLVSSGILDELARTPRNQLLSQFEVEHPKLRSLEFRDLLSRRTQDYALWEALSYVEKDEQFEKLYAAIHRERIITNRLALLQASLSEQNLELLPDYENRLEVLKELKFIDDRATVLLKGRVACEINSSHELILTEVILDNIMADFDPAETVALLSSFVFQGKTESEPLLTPNLQQGCDRLAKIADRIEAVSLRNKVAEHDQASSGKGRPNFGMVELVWQWAQGMPFSELMEMSEIQEGVIVRTMTRLDESCREVRDAARIIGDISLGKKMEACQALIRRDVVFVSSLYI